MAFFQGYDRDHSGCADATDDALGADQWALGPTFVTLKQQGPWTSGLLVNHLWTIGGEDDIDKENDEPLFRLAARRGISLSPSDSINASYVEPWVSYGTELGTTLSVSAECTYDWSPRNGWYRWF